MSAQVKTVAASLFERLDVFLNQGHEKPMVLELASLRRDAQSLKKVDALQAYVAEGLIAALVDDASGVQTAYRAARRLNMGFYEYNNFFIAFHRVFDLVRMSEMMDSLMITCNRSDVAELKAAIDHATFLMRIHDAAQLGQSARLLRSWYEGNTVVELMVELGLNEAVLHELVRLVYKLLAQHRIRIVRFVAKHEFTDTEYAYFVLQYHVSGYDHVQQLAQLQQQLDVLVSEYEDTQQADLSSVVPTLLPYRGAA